jgi:hypothetical protein
LKPLANVRDSGVGQERLALHIRLFVGQEQLGIGSMGCRTGREQSHCRISVRERGAHECLLRSGYAVYTVEQRVEKANESATTSAYRDMVLAPAPGATTSAGIHCGPFGVGGDSAREMGREDSLPIQSKNALKNGHGFLKFFQNIFESPSLAPRRFIRVLACTTPTRIV